MTTALMAESSKYMCAFIVTAKILNISKAAVELGIDPATLSRQLTRYEKILGVKLLERNNRKISLTDKGRALLELVEPSYENLWAGIETMRKSSHAISIIKFGFPISLSTAIPELVKGLHNKYPHWKIELFPGHGNQLVAAVEDHILDLAVVAPLPKTLGDLAGINIGEQFLDFIHHESLKKWANNLMIEPQEMRNLSLIGFPPEFWIRKITDQILTAAGISVIPAIESSDIETVIGLVACGLGVAIIPRQKEKHEGISYKKIDSPYAKRTIGIIRKNSSPKYMHPVHTYIHAYFTDWLNK